MTNADNGQLARRCRLLGWLIAAPAVIAALGTGAIEVWRLRAPDAPLFATPFAYSLADAIERDDVSRAYAFISAGQDPNDPIAVRHPVLTGDRPVLVPPLLWAVATDARQSVQMLVGFGAKLDPVTQRSATCMARALQHTDMMTLLRRYQTISSYACPDLDADERMLLPFPP